MSFHQHQVRTRARPGPRRSARGGFSLVELAIALSILLIGMVSIVTASSQMNSLRRQSRERAMVQNGVRSVAERMQARALQLAQSDPGGWSQTLAAEFVGTFDILELDAVTGEPAVGAVQVVTDEGLTDADLLVAIGMPRDLNGDGDASDADVTAGAVLLPVVVTARWRGVSGEQTYRHGFYLLKY